MFSIIVAVAGLSLCLAILAQLVDERPSEWLLYMLIMLSSPIWLPIALVVYVTGILAGEHDWRGDQK